LIKALHAEGTKIQLHLFIERNNLSNSLQLECESIHYYKQKKGHTGFCFDMPYSVSMRSDESLLERLNQNDFPIIFHGIESTYFLSRGHFNDRKTMIRLQTWKHQKYKKLFHTHPIGFHKIRYKLKEICYKKFEIELCRKYRYAIIPSANEDTITSNANDIPHKILPHFIGMSTPMGIEGNGHYCFFHGDFSNTSTELTAQWLLKEVFNEIELPFVIVAKNPSVEIENLAHEKMHTCIVANPSDKELVELIKKAHIHILPTNELSEENNDLILSSQLGRHILIKREHHANKGLQSICHTANTASEFKKKITALFDLPFTNTDIENRQRVTSEEFDDKTNASKLLKLLY